ncbi:uncharacterized protein LOC122192596 isoform X2 [Lagopus leucura]|uniref:uncharacterized protein LOC122192596 isoform X2 n=1 Tax=Lagopus leucura TaxID=30410 RepID=UPI001C664D13|nr:uncharacterized protein LOC122192596 isoform X2 [Lagopus leucura]
MQPAWKHRLSLWILSKITHPLLMMVVTSSDVLDGIVDVEELLTWISNDPRENQDGSKVREKYQKGDLLQDELLGEVDSQEREQLIAWISATEPQSPDVSSSPAPPCFIAQLLDFPQYSRRSARKHRLLPGPPRPTMGAAAIPRAALQAAGPAFAAACCGTTRTTTADPSGCSCASFAPPCTARGCGGFHSCLFFKAISYGEPYRKTQVCLSPYNFHDSSFWCPEVCTTSQTLAGDVRDKMEVSTGDVLRTSWGLGEEVAEVASENGEFCFTKMVLFNKNVIT